MTREKSFKRLVRMRIEKTGESYTSARATLLAADDVEAAEAPALTMSDAAIRRRRARGRAPRRSSTSGWPTPRRPSG